MTAAVMSPVYMQNSASGFTLGVIWPLLWNVAQGLPSGAHRRLAVKNTTQNKIMDIGGHNLQMFLYLNYCAEGLDHH